MRFADGYLALSDGCLLERIKKLVGCTINCVISVAQYAFGEAGAGHIRFAFSCSTAQFEKAAKLLPGVLRENIG